MIYFKKTYFDNREKAGIEAAIRKSAIKCTSLINLETSTSDIGTDKYFFGFENKKALFFTRVRTSFERILPKVVFKLSKSEDEFFYGFRLGTITLLAFFLIGFGSIVNLAFVIAGKIPATDSLTPLLFLLILLGLIWLELKITSSKIQKAIEKYQMLTMKK